MLRNRLNDNCRQFDQNVEASSNVVGMRRCLSPDSTTTCKRFRFEMPARLRRSLLVYGTGTQPAVFGTAPQHGDLPSPVWASLVISQG